MGYFGHSCELPWYDRPMGPCPACEYAREMRDIAENAAKLKDVVKKKWRNDASRADPVPAVDPSRSTPNTERDP